MNLPCLAYMSNFVLSYYFSKYFWKAFFVSGTVQCVGIQHYLCFQTCSSCFSKEHIHTPTSPKQNPESHPLFFLLSLYTWSVTKATHLFCIFRTYFLFYILLLGPSFFLTQIKQVSNWSSPYFKSSPPLVALPQGYHNPLPFQWQVIISVPHPIRTEN